MPDFPGARSSRSFAATIRRARRSGIRSGGAGRAVSAEVTMFTSGEVVELASGDQEAIDPDGVATDPTETT